MFILENARYKSCHNKIYKKSFGETYFKKTFFLRSFDKVFNPVLGKSIAFYFVQKMKLGMTQENAYVNAQKIGLFIIRQMMAELCGMIKVNVIHGIIVSV